MSNRHTKKQNDAEQIIRIALFRRQEKKVLLLLGIVYFVLWIILPKPSVWQIDNGVRYVSMRAFAETGSLQLDYPGYSFDAEGRFNPLPKPYGLIENEKVITTFSPLFIVLGGALVWLLGSSGPWLLPLLGGWLTLWASWMLWIRHRNKHDGSLYIFMLGLGSPLLFYSMTLWEHSLAAALAVLSIVFLSKGRSEQGLPDILEIVLAGFFAGLAGSFRTEAWILAPTIIVLWRWTNRSNSDAARYIIGFGLAGVITTFVNLWQTGSIIPLHIFSCAQVTPISGLYRVVITRVQNLYLMTIAGFRTNLLTLAATTPFILVVFWRRWRFERSLWPWLGVGLVIVWALYLTASLNDPNPDWRMRDNGGLLYILPISVLSVLFYRGERRKFWMLLWLLPITFTLAVAAFIPTVLGIQWGPRLLLTIIPIILLNAVTRVQRWWKHYPVSRPIMVVLLIFSILAQMYSYYVLYSAKSMNKAYNQWVNDNCGSTVVFADRWLLGEACFINEDSNWFFTDRREYLDTLLVVFREKGLKDITYVEATPFIGVEVWEQIGAKAGNSAYFRGARKGERKIRATDITLTPPEQPQGGL